MKNKVGILVIIIILLIVALGAVSILYLNEKVDRTSEKNNFLIVMDEQYPDSLGRTFYLNYSEHIIYPNGETTNNDLSSYYGEYYYTGKEMGKLFINDKEIKIDGAIYDMAISANYSDRQAAYLGVTEGYEYVSTLYILFDNGIIGKITTNDIKNGNYNVTIMSEYNNIEHFIETQPIEHGGGCLLWAVSKDGNVYKVDLVEEDN